MPCPSIGQKQFWTIQIILSGTKCFGQIQIILVMFKLDCSVLIVHNLDLNKMMWTRPKKFGLDQNNMDGLK